MTWWSACVSPKILAMCWGKHHRTFNRLKKFFFLSMTHEISAFVHFNVSQATNKHHQTDSQHIAGLLESSATWSYTQQDISWVEHASWLSFIPLWLEAYYIFLRTSHFSLSSSSHFPNQQIMAPQTPPPGWIESESSHMTGASSISSLAKTQQQCRHQLVQCNSAIAATENMTQDAHLNKVHNTGHSNITKQHVIGCFDLYIYIDGGLLTI